MTESGVVAVRTSRHGRLILARADRLVGAGTVVLVDQAGSSAVARVVVGTDQFLADPGEPVDARVVAAGATHPAVLAALAERDRATLADVRGWIGEGAAIGSVHWDPDLGRLTVTLDRAPASLLDLQHLLESRLQAAVRLEVKNPG